MSKPDIEGDGVTMRTKKEQLQYNRNGIPIDRHVSLALLKVIGVDDPFEGQRYDPQFESIQGERGIRPLAEGRTRMPVLRC